MMNNISVLMSVYKGEKPDYFRKAMNSIFNQETKPKEVVLVVDGEVGDELTSAIQEFKSKDIELQLIYLEKQESLGAALQEGLKKCKYEYIARMDTDDIARLDRLTKQIAYLNNHEDIVALGGNISEFNEETKPIRIKRMPTSYEEIYTYGKYRNPINHMTVMFRKSAVLSVGGYENMKGLEDYDLRIRLLASGYKLANLDDVLVDVRLGKNFASRRGGKDYFNNYVKLRKKQFDLGYTNKTEYYKSLLATFAMTRVPNNIRELAYKILRKG